MGLKIVIHTVYQRVKKISLTAMALKGGSRSFSVGWLKVQPLELIYLFFDQKIFG